MSYWLYEYEMLAHQQGEGYIYEQQGDGGELGEFDTLCAALAALSGWKAPKDPSITRAKRGLDSVSYWSAIVYEDEFDEDGECVGMHSLEGRDNLPVSWRQAMEEHKRDYWKFLDYESGDYYYLETYIGV